VVRKVSTTSEASRSNRPGNRFKQGLGKRQQVGLFAALSSSHVAELLALCGFDWLVIDTEHTPNDLGDVVDQLRSVVLHDVAPVVRAAWNDPILVKQLLDTGAQSVLFPSIETPEQAARAVSFTRYPPAGIRGVANSSRAGGFGTDGGYLKSADEAICVIVQIETVRGLDNLEAIAVTRGVDAVFIGPADLAASLGHLGEPQHPTVQQAIDDALRTLKALRKPRGYLTGDLSEARRRLAEGVDFLALGTDALLLARAAKGVLAQVRSQTPA
jgi:4-hydroxy-2-oxoheptanedioate aldolase